jgi:hypothetical protein
MPQLISSPSRIPVPGGKVIEEYVAVCLPAFAPELAHREGE